MSHSTTRELAI